VRLRRWAVRGVTFVTSQTHIDATGGYQDLPDPCQARQAVARAYPSRTCPQQTPQSLPNPTRPCQTTATPFHYTFFRTTRPWGWSCTPPDPYQAPPDQRYTLPNPEAPPRPTDQTLTALAGPQQASLPYQTLPDFRRPLPPFFLGLSPSCCFFLLFNARQQRLTAPSLHRTWSPHQNTTPQEPRAPDP
jgi:hypothetical protein